MEPTKNNFLLTQDILKSLKCSVCDYYLSVPPISIISEDGSKYKCGRCTVKCYVHCRAFMYENLAKMMTFPCINKGCGEILIWKNVLKHEKYCDYRLISCIDENCNEKVLWKNYASHVKEKHDKLFHQGSVSLKNVHHSFGMCILEYDEKTYIVLFDRDTTNMGFTVCHLELTNKRYNLLINSPESKLSILITDEKIVPFDDRIHCYRCIRGTCKIESHPHNHNRKGILKNMTTKFEKEIIQKTFGKGQVIFKIEVVDEKIDADVDLTDILLGKEMIIDEVNDEEDTVESIPQEDDFFQKLLKCPSCTEPMGPPIYECLNGHTVCGNCKNQSETCSTCNVKVDNTRNYIFEEIAVSLNDANQEDKEDKSEDLNRDITCPMSKCLDTVNLKLISNHFQEKHIDNFHFNVFSVRNIYAYYNVDVLVKNGKTYLILLDFDDINFGITMCSLEKDDHYYEVSLSSSDNKYKLTADRQKIILFDDKEHCFKCSIGICKIENHVYRKKKKEIFRRLRTKINRSCIRRMFDTNSMNYKISIVDVKNNVFKDQILRQAFECPICKDYMIPPIHQCIAGHALCHNCRQRLEKCPSCEAPIQETRNLALETVAADVEIACQYEGEDCAFRAGLKRIATHEVDCHSNNMTKRPCLDGDGTS